MPCRAPRHEVIHVLSLMHVAVRAPAQVSLVDTPVTALARLQAQLLGADAVHRPPVREATLAGVHLHLEVSLDGRVVRVQHLVRVPPVLASDPPAPLALLPALDLGTRRDERPIPLILRVHRPAEIVVLAVTDLSERIFDAPAPVALRAVSQIYFVFVFVFVFAGRPPPHKRGGNGHTRATAATTWGRC